MIDMTMSGAPGLVPIIIVVALVLWGAAKCTFETREWRIVAEVSTLAILCATIVWLVSWTPVACDNERVTASLVALIPEVTATSKSVTRQVYAEYVAGTDRIVLPVRTSTPQTVILYKNTNTRCMR